MVSCRKKNLATLQAFRFSYQSSRTDRYLITCGHFETMIVTMMMITLMVVTDSAHTYLHTTVLRFVITELMFCLNEN
jgi:hypothetical protein